MSPSMGGSAFPRSTGNAGKDRTLVALSFFRQAALSARICASSVKTRLSSVAACPISASARAAVTAGRTSVSNACSSGQSPASIRMPISTAWKSAEPAHTAGLSTSASFMVFYLVVHDPNPAGPFPVAIVRLDDFGNQRVAHDIGFVEADSDHARHAFQDP